MKGILYMDTQILENKELFEKCMSLISEDRKDKILQFKSDLPARLSLGAGVLLQIALDKCGLRDKMNEIKYGEHGKPYLPNTDFYFNLSHSGEYAVCAYSDAPIGADLQKIKSKIPNHTKRILSASEESFLNTLDDMEKGISFYRLWTRKESLIKWDGRGLRLPLKAFSFIDNEKFTNQLNFEGNILYFREYDFLFPDYSFCVCSQKNTFPELIKEITSEFLMYY